MSRGRGVPVVQNRVLAPEAEEPAVGTHEQPPSQRSLSPVALGLVASRAAWFEGRGTAEASLGHQGGQLLEPASEHALSVLDEGSSQDASADSFPGTPPREATLSATSLSGSPAAASSPKSPWTSATGTTTASSSASA